MPDLSDDIRTLIQRGIAPVTFEEITRRRGPRSPRPRLLARVASVAVVLAVAVPVLVVVSTARSTTSSTLHDGGARHRLIAALDTTLASGSFDFTASQPSVTAPTATPTTTTPCPRGLVSNTVVGKADAPTTVVCVTGNGASGLDITAQGTMDTNPFGMEVNAQVPGLGLITLLDNGTNIWEIGGGDYGTAGVKGTVGPGAPIAGFATSVEGTLGPRQGGSDMMSLANPNGYLELDQSAITTTDEIGTATVDGVPVTVYQATLSPAQEQTVTGANATQTEAINDALAVLQQQGYTGTTIKVSVDTDGYIRQTTSVAHFSDGSTQSSTITLSNFGCAGKVIMPGQSGSSVPPTGCVSPDQAGPTTPTTTGP
jgi:hypothetical protein